MVKDAPFTKVWVDPVKERFDKILGTLNSNLRAVARKMEKDSGKKPEFEEVKSLAKPHLEEALKALEEVIADEKAKTPGQDVPKRVKKARNEIIKRAEKLAGQLKKDI